MICIYISNIIFTKNLFRHPILFFSIQEAGGCHVGTVSEFGGLEIVCNRCGSHLGRGNSGVSKDEDTVYPPRN